MANKPDDQLSALRTQIDSSKVAQHARVECTRNQDQLVVRIKGQTIGLWRAEGSYLALYKPGCSRADGHATNPAKAAFFTARLIAAAGQA